MTLPYSTHDAHDTLYCVINFEGMPSVLQQLQLSGIRSFDPNPANKQTIFFQKPLTVILGKNGAGKTTVIEAVLNAIAGIMPPGSGQEKSSFIYDPKIIGEGDVKAQIRLIFTGKDGKLTQVIRSFQVTRVRAKMTFNTLDNTIAYQDPDSGKVISSTYKASQVDHVVPQMLGVSPAVLEHVIFCHQEASNWPLSSPKEVKQIFDAIFSATRYVLALERFRELAKEYRQQLKDQEVSFTTLREHREQAQHLRDDIQKKELAVKAVQQQSTETAPQLMELQSALNALESVDREVEQLTTDAAVIEGKLQEKRKQFQLAVGKLSHSHVRDGSSLEEIQEELVTCKERLTAAEQLKDTLLPQLQHIAERYRKLETDHNEVSFSIQKLEREEFQHNEHCKKLKQLLDDSGIENTSELIRWSEDKGGSCYVNQEELSAVVKRAWSTFQTLTQNMQAALRATEERINVEQEKRQQIVRRIDAGDKELGMIEGIVSPLKKDMDATQAKLAALPAHLSVEYVHKLRERVKDNEMKVHALETLRNQSSRQQELQRISEELEAQRQAAGALRTEMLRVRAISKEEQELKKVETYREDRLLFIQRQVEQHLLPLALQFGYSVEMSSDILSEYRKCALFVEEHNRQLSEKHKQTKKTLKELEQRVIAANQQKAQLIENIVQYEAKFASVSEAITTELLLSDVQEFLEDFEQRMKQSSQRVEGLERNLREMRAFSDCISDFMSSATEHQACPLCERPFDVSTLPLEQFLNRNEQRIVSADVLKEAQNSLELARVELVRLQNVRDKVQEARLLSLHIQSLKSQMELYNSEKSITDKEDMDIMQNKCNEEEEEMDISNRACHLVANLLPSIQEVEQLDYKVEMLQKQLQLPKQREGSDLPKRTVEELIDLHESAISRQHELEAQLALHHASDEKEDVVTAERTLSELKLELYRAEVDLQKRNNLESTINDLQVQLQDWKVKHEELVRQRPLLKSGLEKMDRTIHGMQLDRSKNEAKWRDECTTAQQLAVALEPAVERVFLFLRSGGYNTLRQLQEKKSTSEAELQSLRTKEVELQHKATEMDESLNQYRVELKVLQDYHELLMSRVSLEEDEKQLNLIHERLSAVKTSKLHGVEKLLGKEAHTIPMSVLRERIRDEIRQLDMKQAQLRGRAEALQDDVAQLKETVGHEKYRDIERRYRFTFVQVHTTKMTIKDIDKYYVALEKAVQSYHQEKISHINQIIADLWRQTYRGSDIDAVEIKSETETTSVATGRRSYNYRVVMKRGGSEIDMRGRCSAGQKVLASIIIRLALSEAFCFDCGILALDEPTTNLDEDNARSLAEALQVLIENRRIARHFQLIVITHDEKFVRALGGHSLDRFYFIHKDREGAFSKIEERTFDQLFA